MLDKLSARIIEYLRNAPDNKIKFLHNMISNIPVYTDPEDTFGVSRDSFIEAIKYLEANGHVVIGYTRPTRGEPQPGTLKLTHTERNRKEFSRIRLINYVIYHWIAITALIISVWAFIRTLL